MQVSVTDSRILVHKVPTAAMSTFLKSMGGKEVPISRRLAPTQIEVEFPRKVCFLRTIVRGLPDIVQDVSVEEFLLTLPTQDHVNGPDNDEMDPRLFPYQQDAVRFLVGGNRLLSIPPGRGKTPVTVQAAKLINAKRVLIVSPLILLRQWLGEIREWDDRDLDVHFYRVSGRPIDRNFEGFIVTNYAMVERNLALFTAVKWDLVILDESILIKNRQTKRFKKMKDLRASTRRMWLLSGFPITTDASDLWAQFHVLEPKAYRSFWTFTNTYCNVFQGTWGLEILGSRKNLDFVHEFADMMRVVPLDVVDLPQGHIQRFEVDLTNEQLRLYEKAETDFLLELATGDVPIPNRLTQMIRLSQIVSNINHFGYSSESGKLQALIDLREMGYLRPPILIWARFSKAIEGILNLIRAKTFFSVRVIDGSTPTEKRDEYIDAFRSGKLDVLIMQLQTGKFGLNLVETNTVVYYELTNASDDLNQSFYRVFRIGLDHEPTVLSLHAFGTIDDLISTNLTEKTEDLSLVSRDRLVQVLTMLKEAREEKVLA